MIAVKEFDRDRMTRLLLLALCCSTAALAAPRSFADFSSHLPTLTLPVPSEDRAHRALPLSAEDAIAWVLAPAASASSPMLGRLAALWDITLRPTARALLQGRPGTERLSRLRIAVRGVVPRSTHLALVVSLDFADERAFGEETYLLTYAYDGAFIDGTLLGASVSGVDGEPSSIRGQLDADGRLARYQEQDDLLTSRAKAGLVDDQLPGRLLADGHFDERPRTWEGLTGYFIDRGRRGELMVVDGAPPQVYFRAAERSPWRTLGVPENALGRSLVVRFANSPRPHRLTWDGRGATVAWTSPDGRTRTFDRWLW